MKIVQPIRKVEDIDRFRDYFIKKNYRDYMLFEIGVSLGYRVSDLAPLQVKDVRNRTHVYITQQKTGKGLPLKMRNKILSLINDYTLIMDDEQYLFPSRKGGHIGRQQVFTILKNASNELGIEDVACHTLRKTFGYHLYKETNNLGLVQMMLGQTSQAATIRYIGISQDMMDDAIELLPY